MSQICALTVFPSTWIDRVANSTPMVDLLSRLNSLRVNRESTARPHAMISRHVWAEFQIAPMGRRQGTRRTVTAIKSDQGQFGRRSQRKALIGQESAPLSYARVTDQHNLEVAQRG